MTPPLHIAAFGEAMTELRETPSGDIRQDFGGDTYNTLVHLKRLMGKEIKTSFVSANGADPFSRRFADRLAFEQIEPEFLYRDPARQIGLYAISTDEEGERSFSYWRSDSAARHLLSHPDFSGDEVIAAADVIYVSGISLAIWPVADRREFFNLLERAKARNIKIVFDPNYRPQLWESLDIARRWIEGAYRLADVILTSAEDEQRLFSRPAAQVISGVTQSCGERDIVVTQGEGPILARLGGEEFSASAARADSVIDTTGAGDAFNAGFLAAYLTGQPHDAALHRAAQLAAYIVTIPGAVPPLADFQTSYQGQASS